MKSIRKQNCILAIVMFALMSILTSFPVQAQTINQKQAKVTVQYASIPAKVETSSSGDIFITVKNISDDYRADYDMRVLNNKGNVVEVSEQNGGSRRDYFYCGTGKVFWQGGHSRQNERTDYVPAG